MLRIATYNVHAGVGRDGRRDTTRTLQVLEELEADVVALQEFADLPDGSGNLLTHYAAQTGSRALIAPTLKRGAADYGNVLLSRLPTLRWRAHDLSVPGLEPRCAIEALLAAGGLRIRLLATHLGLRRRERSLQCRRLLELLDRGEADCDIVVGDINEWRRGAEALACLDRRLGMMPAPRSFPSGRPLFALDRIWVRPATMLCRLATHRSALARRASDHLPVVADIGLHLATGTGGRAPLE